ncbi:hypothetical protein SBV1_940041 [Verrucomicrobia bacterium]|nr:hypothetical protein SBV1_940041 [Verrucomicrobiota bacterium]
MRRQQILKLRPGVARRSSRRIFVEGAGWKGIGECWRAFAAIGAEEQVALALTGAWAAVTLPGRRCNKLNYAG